MSLLALILAAFFAMNMGGSGMPEPMVMLDATSIMGIGSANHGHRFIAMERKGRSNCRQSQSTRHRGSNLC